jgi:hypothetical protein
MSLKIFKCLGANGLIGAIGAPLDDCFLENILEIFFKIFKIYIYYKIYYFVKVCVKKIPQIYHFQSFPRLFPNPFIA